MVKSFKRLQKEAKEIEDDFKEILEMVVVREDWSRWHIKFVGAAGSVYEGEPYTLQFSFNNQYPIEPPEVQFIGVAPIHEHVYSNGFICLSTLDSDWSPALKVSSVCLSVLSMLSSADEKKSPPNESASLAYFAGKTPRQVRWEFHDEKC